jgi:hypothetical protein
MSKKGFGHFQTAHCAFLTKISSFFEIILYYICVVSFFTKKQRLFRKKCTLSQKMSKNVQSLFFQKMEKIFFSCFFGVFFQSISGLGFLNEKKEKFFSAIKKIILQFLILDILKMSKKKNHELLF